MDPYLLVAAAEGCDESIVRALLDPHADPEVLLRGELPLPPRVRARLADRGRLADTARRWSDEAGRLGLDVLTPSDPRYPAPMRMAPQRPAVLFARGDLAALDRSDALAVTIVGSRTPTAYGLAATRDFANSIALAGLPIWSGLAAGIDRAAHEACLAHDVPTVAVVAGGLDSAYPASNRDLFARIPARGGLLLTETPPGVRPRRGHFPRRNRILALATSAVLVVEAGNASGTMHTARWAAESGVPVFALPGPYTSPRSIGCHHLIADGAAITCDPGHLLQELATLSGADVAVANRRAASADERAILERLELGPRPSDLVRRESRLDDETFLATLLRLLETKAIQQLPGDFLGLGHGVPRTAPQEL